MGWYWFFGAVGALLVLLLAVKIVGRVLRYKSYSVGIPKLPSAFDGFRIAVISDLHDRCFGPRNRALVKKVLASRADLVVLAGDMHEEPHPRQPFYDLISGIAAELPITYTEGNHDLRHISDEEYARHVEQLAACGAVVLNDSSYPLERNGQILMLYGQSWKSIKAGDQPEFDPNFASVLVAHNPLQFDRLQKLPDLMISGHVHGGILRLPWIGPVFAPGDGAPLKKRFHLEFFFPKYSRGLYRKGDQTLAVTQGLGFSVLPIRFIPPEVMILTLRPEKK